MKKYIQVIGGILISAFLVWWLFHDTNWEEVGNSIKNIKLGWFALAHVPLLFSFLFRIIRWKYIVNAVHPTSIMKLASATHRGDVCGTSCFSTRGGCHYPSGSFRVG